MSSTENNENRIYPGARIFEHIFEPLMHEYIFNDHMFTESIFNENVFNRGGELSIESEINNALDRVGNVVMTEFISVGNNSFPILDEDRLMSIAQQESLNHYNNMEKKPGVVLNMEDNVASSDNKEDMCTICVSSVDVGEKIVSLECNHVFHTPCISEWVKYKSECPVCRHSINTIII